MPEVSNNVDETDAPCGGRSSTAAERDRISERRNRSADFQAAWRGLTPLIGADHANTGRGLAKEILERLRTLDENVRSKEDWPSDAEAEGSEAETLDYALNQLDADLDQYARLLCRHLEGATHNRFSGHLYPIDEADRGGIAALVDFILGVDPRLERHGMIFDLLVTLLSTGERNGYRRIVHDPATLTPELRSRTERAAASSDQDLSRVEREFMEAARRSGESLPDELLREMHMRKEELGGSILAPQVLRSVVFFNVAAWNAGHRGEGCGPSRIPSPPRDTNGSEMQTPDTDELVESRTQAARAASGSPAGSSPEHPLDISTVPTTVPLPTSDTRDVSEVRWRIAPPPPEAPAPRRPKNTRIELRTSIRFCITASSLAVALFLATHVWLLGSEGTARPLSTVDLRAISTQLDSGYRSDFGSGPLFVGTLRAEWRHLSSSEQQRSAKAIIRHLGRSGAKEILVYDDQMRIALHSAEGLPLRLGRSSE